MSILNDKRTIYTENVVDGNLELDPIDLVNIDQVFEEGFVYYTVTQPYVGRIDLISFVAYRTTRLWWLIALANDMIDVEAETTLDAQIKIPSLDRYYEFYNKNSKPNTAEGKFNTEFLN